MRTFTLLSFFLTISSYSLANQEVAVSFNEQTNRLHYLGEMSQQGIAKLKQLYLKHKQSVEWLEITSKGGDISFGMDLGDFVHEHQLNVSVPKYCLSSCANYVFTSANNKQLGPNALIGFHGGASSNNFDSSSIQQQIQSAPKQQRAALRAQLKQFFDDYIASANKREKAFFNKIGVKQEITTLGEADVYQEIANREGYVGWYYSLKDLNKLGVNNIDVIGGVWQLQQLAQDKKVFKVEVALQ